jgi:hypothetical protein
MTRNSCPCGSTCPLRSMVVRVYPVPLVHLAWHRGCPCFGVTLVARDHRAHPQSGRGCMWVQELGEKTTLLSTIAGRGPCLLFLQLGESSAPAPCAQCICVHLLVIFAMGGVRFSLLKGGKSL